MPKNLHPSDTEQNSASSTTQSETRKLQLDAATILSIFEEMGLGTSNERKAFTRLAEAPYSEAEPEENIFIRLSTHSSVDTEVPHA